jgi:mRNA interferase HigB
MRLITNKRLREYAAEYPTCLPSLEHWEEIMEANDFADIVAVRQKFPHADLAKVKSGRTVTIFNIKNHFRLITSIHYNHKAIYILRLLTHAEYDKNFWKNEL